MPIRLVIALVVGVAALGIMMQVLGTFDFGADQEVDVEFDESVIDPSSGGSSVTITVVDDTTGEPIPEADVIVRGDTLPLDSPYTGTTNSDGEFKFDVDSDLSKNWGATQKTGKIKFEIIPPADSPYTDDQSNEKLTIIKDD